MRVLLWIIPIFLVVVIFFITKPSDQKCREAAVEKLASLHVKAAAGDILIKDLLLFKTIKLVSGKDTFSLGYGALTRAQFSERKLANLSGLLRSSAVPPSK